MFNFKEQIIMKKISLIAALAAATLVLVSSCGAQKMATATATSKSRAQELREEGYQPAEVSFTKTIEDVLNDFNTKFDSGNYIAIEGSAEATDERSTAQSMASIVAASDYATSAKSRVKGAITREYGDEIASDETYSRIIAKFGQLVGEAIIPFLEPKATFYREKEKNGKLVYEVVVLYLIDREDAANVESNAINQAVRTEVAEVGLQKEIFNHLNNLDFQED